MNITGDGITTIGTFPGLTYRFSATGDFAGGSVSVEWGDKAGNWAQYQGSSFTSDGERSFIALSYRARIVVDGTGSPDLEVIVVRERDIQSAIGSNYGESVILEARNSSTIFINYASINPIPMDTVSHDPFEGFDGSVYTIPETGSYEIMCQGLLLSSDTYGPGAYKIDLGVALNEEFVTIGMTTNDATGASDQGCGFSGAIIRTLAAGTEIFLYCYCDGDMPPSDIPLVQSSINILKL